MNITCYWTSLVVQWLRLSFHFRVCVFYPWFELNGIKSLKKKKQERWILYATVISTDIPNKQDSRSVFLQATLFCSSLSFWICSEVAVLTHTLHENFYQAIEPHWSLLSYKISIIRTVTPNLQFQLMKTSMGVDIIFPFLEEGRQDS